jgi:hypothetical protein
MPTPAPTQGIDIQALLKLMQQVIGALPVIQSDIAAVKQQISAVRSGQPASLPDLQWPGSAKALDPATDTTVATAPVVAVDASNKTGLGTGILATIAALALGATGVTGTPIGVDASTTGALLPLAGVGVSLLGAFGKLAPILRAVMLVL